MPDNFIKGTILVHLMCTNAVGIQFRYSNATLTKNFKCIILELEKDKDPSYNVDVNKHSESLDKKQSGKKIFYSCTYF